MQTRIARFIGRAPDSLFPSSSAARLSYPLILDESQRFNPAIRLRVLWFLSASNFTMLAHTPSRSEILIRSECNRIFCRYQYNEIRWELQLTPFSGIRDSANFMQSMIYHLKLDRKKECYKRYKHWIITLNNYCNLHIIL